MLPLGRGPAPRWCGRSAAFAFLSPEAHVREIQRERGREGGGGEASWGEDCPPEKGFFVNGLGCVCPGGGSLAAKM